MQQVSSAPVGVVVTTEVVIFTIQERRLKLLLVNRRREPEAGGWALPGGTARHDADLDASARRELEEQTGLTGVYLEQLYTFSRPSLAPTERVISVAYYALTPSDRLQLRPATGGGAAWFPMDGLPDLAFNHADMVTMAHRRLAAKLDYSTIAFQFMPDLFSLGELQEVYETILREAVDKRNFRKWVLALEQIEETSEERRSGPHRPARLYRLKHPRRVEIIK